MPDTGFALARRWLRWIGVGVALLVVLVLIVVVGVLRQGENQAPRPISTPATSTSSPGPTALAVPVAPASRIDTASLTVPEETRFAANEFAVTGGVQYLVTFALETEKPAGSDGYAMYLGVTFSCVPQGEGGAGGSVGGTQNLLTGEPTTYRNQLLLTPDADGVVSCTIKASAPYDDVASAGTSFGMTATWKVEAVDGAGYSAPADERLPLTIPSGQTASAFTQNLHVEDLTHGRVRALTSLHLTTCTIVNGSREDDRAWCSEEQLDEAGSTVKVELRAELIGADGAGCDELGTETTAREHIDLYRHHRLLSLELVEALPQEPCGEIARLTVSVHNEGPAPLVVHRSNSSLVMVGE